MVYLRRFRISDEWEAQCRRMGLVWGWSRALLGSVGESRDLGKRVWRGEDEVLKQTESWSKSQFSVFQILLVFILGKGSFPFFILLYILTSLIPGYKTCISKIWLENHNLLHWLFGKYTLTFRQPTYKWIFKTAFIDRPYTIWTETKHYVEQAINLCHII